MGVLETATTTVDRTSINTTARHEEGQANNGGAVSSITSGGVHCRPLSIVPPSKHALALLDEHDHEHSLGPSFSSSPGVAQIHYRQAEHGHEDGVDDDDDDDDDDVQLSPPPKKVGNSSNEANPFVDAAGSAAAARWK
jgi:hypothetical protein